uniref:Uncharacterized protein n=1 Tax=Oryza glumipatula TaxID=40148 RepID=A0A0D9ZBJ8_9ORYZ
MTPWRLMAVAGERWPAAIEISIDGLHKSYICISCSMWLAAEDRVESAGGEDRGTTSEREASETVLVAHKSHLRLLAKEKSSQPESLPCTLLTTFHDNLDAEARLWRRRWQSFGTVDPIPATATDGDGPDAAEPSEFLLTHDIAGADVMHETVCLCGFIAVGSGLACCCMQLKQPFWMA